MTGRSWHKEFAPQRITLDDEEPRGRGAPTKARRMSSIERRELGKAEHQVVIAARRAVVDVIERAALGPGIERRALAATAIAGLFADVVTSLRMSPAAGQIIDVINRQLREVGIEIRPVERN